LILNAGHINLATNSQLRHAGLDPASSVLLDSRLRGNDNLQIFIRRSNNRIESDQDSVKLQKGGRDKMNRIIICVEGISMEAEVYDTPTGQAILAALPLESTANLWGEEIYFDIPITLGLESDAREIVAVGDLGYWPMGSAFCIFFGPTPVSQGDEPRAYSPVNVFGKISGEANVFRQASSGSLIRVDTA
jgi:hypothetical protein